MKEIRNPREIVTTMSTISPAVESPARIPRRGIAFKLAVAMLLSCTLILVAIIGVHYRVSRAIIEKELADSAAIFTQSTVNFIDAKIRPVEEVTRSMATLLEQMEPTETGLKTFVKSFVTINPDIFGSIVAFEPFGFDGKTRNFAIYFCESSPDFIYEKHDYFNEEWYRAPRASAAPAWSEPYYDREGGRIVMTTYSVPFRRGKGAARKIMGIVTSDISLDWLQRMISSIRMEKTGYCFLVSQKGAIIAHPAKDYVLTGNIGSLARTSGDTALQGAARGMTAGSSGLTLIRNPMTGRPAWLSYAPVPSCRWSLGIIFPQDEVDRDIVVLNRTVIAIGVAGAGALLAVIIVLAGTITRPLRLLAEKTLELAGGNLDVELPRTGSGDEVGSLTAMFIHMRDSLKRYIRDLTETTTAKERMEKELQIAREIQMSLLPGGSSPFPGRGEFDIFAVLEPSREVGGDFYDFFLLDERRLFFAVGDVSGKGVPAALLMSRIQTIVRTAARLGLDAGAIMAQANREFGELNDSCSFVTVLCGILDTQSGEVAYACGGHEPPLLARSSGECEWLDKAKGMVLGIESGAEYIRKTVTLRPGDILCLYTDGVTEAFNPQREMFTRWKLLEALSAHREEALQELAQSIGRSIEAFAAGAPQSDDITLLLLKFNGAPVKEAP